MSASPEKKAIETMESNVDVSPSAEREAADGLAETKAVEEKAEHVANVTDNVQLSVNEAHATDEPAPDENVEKKTMCASDSSEMLVQEAVEIEKSTAEMCIDEKHASDESPQATDETATEQENAVPKLTNEGRAETQEKPAAAAVASNESASSVQTNDDHIEVSSNSELVRECLKDALQNVVSVQSQAEGTKPQETRPQAKPASEDPAQQPSAEQPIAVER